MTTLYQATCDCGYQKTARTEPLAWFAMNKHSCDHQRALQERANRVKNRIERSGPKRDCVCKYARHEHGTRTAYVVDKCRCRPCREANVAAEGERNRLKAYGRYDSGRVDAQPVREHIQALMDYGIGLKRIAHLAGVSNSTLGKILYGDPARGQKVRARTERHVHDQVLAIQPILENLADGAVVEPTGTRRRLEAFVTIGWSQNRLAQALGLSTSNLNQVINGRRDTTAATARAVRDLYNQLWDKPQTGTDHRTKISASRARKYAQDHGWVPPLMWDEESIDDPAAGPARTEEATLRGVGQPAKKNQHAEDVEFLLNAGAGAAEIPARLGLTPASLQKILYRAGRGDLVTRMKSNERVYERKTA